MSGHIDQVSHEVIGHMRVYMGAQKGIDVNGWTDEEVLAHLDESYAGGAAQFNREQTQHHWTEEGNHPYY